MGGTINLGGADPTKPKADPAALINRYISWVYIMTNKNGVAIAEASPPRLFVTTKTNQRKALCPVHPIRRSDTDFFKASRPIQSLKAMRQADKVEEVAEHPIIDLLMRPNSMLGTFQLFYLTSAYQDLTGDAFWWLPPDPMGVPSTIILLPTQWVKPIRNKQDAAMANVSTAQLAEDKPIKGYAFGARRDKRFFIPEDEVIRFSFPNPKDPFDGFGSLQGVIMASVRDESMDRYEAALNRNMGRPDFLVSPTEPITEGERKSLTADWNNQFKGVDQAGKVLIGSGQMKVEKLGFSPKEMSFLQGRKVTMEQIANGFGVPVSLIKSEGVPRANLESSLFQYAKFTIQPRLIMMGQRMNERLVPMFDNDEFTVSDRIFLAFPNTVPEDKEFELKKQESELKSGVTFINEVRSLDGREPVAGGDVPYISFNVVPLGGAPADATQPVPPPKSHGHASRKDSGHPGGTKIIHFGRFDMTVDKDGFVGDVCDCAVCKQNEEDERSGGANPPPDADEQEVRAIANRMYADDAAIVLAQSPLAIEFSPAAQAAKWTPEMRGPIQRVMLRAGNLGLADAGIDIFPWIDNPEVQKFIDDHTFKFLEQANETLEKNFRAALTEGVQNGESPAQLAKRLEQVFEDTAQAKRSLMIARTETARAQTGGTIAAWKESGVVSAKVWKAPADACPFCLNAQQQWGAPTKGVPLQESFFEQGQVQEVPFGEPTDDNPHPTIKLRHNYSDVAGPPLHPSCRCTLVPVLIEQD